MSSILKNFRGDVAGRSTQRSSEGFLANDFGQAEVGQLNMKILVCEQNILWLDISVNNAPLML